MSAHQPMTGPSVWTGAELAASGDWVRRFDDGHLAEIDAALARVKALGGGAIGFGRAAFPLDRAASLLADVSEALENGRGAVRLRGLPVGRYSASSGSSTGRSLSRTGTMPSASQ